MATPSVLIVGAGPTGLTAAIELKRAGFDVRLIDKTNHQALHSQALVVQARTLEQWQRYGIAAQAVDRGRKLTEAKFWSEGKAIVSFRFDQLASRYPFVLFLPQTETESLLNEYMQSLGVTAERGTELAAITQQGEQTFATLRRANGDEEQVSPRWVIGCDGAHSTVRERMAIPFEGGGVGISFFLGDLEIDGPEAPDNELAIHFHHGDVVFMGRLTDRLTRLIVAVHARQSESTNRELSLEDFQQAVDHAGVRVKVRASEWMTPFRVHDLQAKNYRLGNVFLAGDASHIHSPVGGQGMNTGIQDVANLAWKLAAVARGADDRLLDSYAEERGEVGKKLLKFTERGLKLATTANPLIETVRDALAPVLSHLEPFQKTVSGFISETAIEYRGSSIVSDQGGDGALRAGDRMPDLATLGGGTLLGAWTSGKHLAILLDATEPQEADLRANLLYAEVLSLKQADLDEQGAHFVGDQEKLLIVRPDGYVGYRGPIENRVEWMNYAKQDKIGY